MTGSPASKMENPEKPEFKTAKGAELAEKIRNAAALKFCHNRSDAEIAAHFNVSPYTIADRKRRPEWKEYIRAIADTQVAETCNELFAMAPYARQVLMDLLNDPSPAIRLKVAQMICQLPIRQVLG
jgi:hypothetical protein